MGRFACSSWELGEGVDVNGDERRVIVFHLIKLEDDDVPHQPTSSTSSPGPNTKHHHLPLKPARKLLRGSHGRPDPSTIRGAQRCAHTSWAEQMASASPAIVRPLSEGQTGPVT